MNKTDIIFQPIGLIHSPHKALDEIPIQPVFAQDIEGTVTVFPEFAEGLTDLQVFSHIYLFFYFHKANKTRLKVKPYLSDQERGVFATRSPNRPNKLGLSLVRLTKIEDNILHVKDIDILDGTPLIDIKPYIQRFDSRDNARSGWQDDVSDDTASVRGLRNFKKGNN